MYDKRFRLLTASTAVVLALATAIPAAAVDPGARDVAAAQDALVDEYGGTAKDYVLLAERGLVAGTTPMWSAKFLDSRSGEVRLVYRTSDGKTGGPELRRAAIEEATVGLSPVELKASEELLSRATEATASELLPVAVWMSVDTSEAVAAVIAAHPEIRWEGDRPSALDLETMQALRRELDEARAAVYAEAAAEIEAAIRPGGGQLGYVSLLAPLAYVDTPARTLAALAALDRVRSLGLEGSDWVESLSSAGPYVDADWHSGDLDQGNGVRVGVIEYYNVRGTGDLAGKVVAAHSVSGTITYDTVGLDHPTWVAGAVASQSAMYRGIAPGAFIVSSGTGGGSTGLTRDRNVIRAADWAATTGDADIINMSVNMDSATGRDEARAYFDSIGGGESFRTVVSSAVNAGRNLDNNRRLKAEHPQRSFSAVSTSSRLPRSL